MLELPDQMNQFTITFNASCSSPIEPLSDRRPQKIIKYQKNHHMYARYYNSSQLWLSVVWKDLNFFFVALYTTRKHIKSVSLESNPTMEW